MVEPVPKPKGPATPLIVVVWHVDGKGSDLWPAGFVQVGAHEQPTTNWLSTGRSVGFTTSVAVAQAVSSPTQV
jgi:hypothetical protein